MQITAQQWVWPTDAAGGPVAVPGGGIRLAGRLGQDVRAASAGRVVYTGSGLRGYGNLIIIKHGDSLLSAYAHNRELLVQEGQDVAAGQVIARMGEGAGEGAGAGTPHESGLLYFEIRQNGKPIDPMTFLTDASHGASGAPKPPSRP
jgi:lipoprotein NlpD